MKTTAIRTCTALCLSALTATLAVRALADQPATETKYDDTYTGTVKSVDSKERRLTVKGVFLSKTFNLGEACTYALLDKPGATLNDLRTGQKVMVGYQNAHGVLVASHVEQKPMRYEGTVKAIDPTARTITLHLRSTDKTFRIGDDCAVMLRDSKAGDLKDVQTGHHVTVTYETPGDMLVARQVEQTSALFTGSLTAIDVPERTVKAKGVFGTKKFHLANGCMIMIKGKPEGEMSDLKPGDKFTISYDPVDGVNVANRIAPAGGASEPMTASQ